MKADYLIYIPNANVNITLYTYASYKGWGAVAVIEKAGGRRTEAETKE